MKVLFVCGSYPPETCSNADTAEIMFKILLERGINAELLSNIDWSFSNWSQINDRIKKSDADVIHIQYPSIGYMYSITPQMLSFFNRKKTIITLHEASQSHLFRKISLLPYSFCREMVFTNQYERNYYSKIYPWTKIENTQVIPIGSNIQAITNLKFSDRKIENIVHFGQIRPDKGIEDVIELAAIIKERGQSFNVIIMGRTYDHFYDFYKKMEEKSANLPVQWLLNVSEAEVSSVLGSNKISYLPYPDGVTERRGSMFAAMVHKMVIFTTKSQQTPPEFDNIVAYKESPQEMADYLSSPSLTTDLDILQNKFELNINLFLNKYNWNSIMDDYIMLYNKVYNETSN